MGDLSISHSVFGPSMDSVAQWLDTSLIPDPALLHLMESDNSMPFGGFEFTSSGSCAEDTFALTANQAWTNDFELANSFGNEIALTEQRKPSIVRSDATSGSFSTLEQPSLVQDRPVSDEVAKVKKEVSLLCPGSISPFTMASDLRG
jgi:hypothetical protein